jgi:uncharacterized peroxidase-related enzyme
MAFIELPTDEELPEVCASDRERFGYVPNLARAFALRPEAYAAWKQLNGAIKVAMDERRYELATIAAARTLRSSYCSLAHGRVLVDKFHTPAEVSAIAAGREPECLDQVDRAVMDFAVKVAADATSVTEEDVDGLRALGLSDADVVDVVLAATARCFFSKTLDALGVQPDAAYLALDAELRDTLTVGRPIEPA